MIFEVRPRFPSTWDYANRLTNVTLTSDLCPLTSVSYTYFPAGQVSNVVSVAGTNIYALDAADRLASIQSPASDFHFSFNTNSGLVSSMLTSNTAAGLGVSYGFDMMDRITNIVWRDSSSNIVRSFRYQYSAADMITNVVREDDSVVEYGYDSLDRLISEKKTLAGATVYEQTFGYDAVGNRTNRTQGSATVSYNYSSGCNRLTAWGTTSTNSFNDFNPTEVSVLGSSTEAIGTNVALGQLCVSNYAGGSGITPSVSGTNFSGSLPITPTNGTYTVCAAIGDEAGNVGYATNTVSVCVVTNTSYSYSDAGCITDIAQSGSGFTHTLSLVWNGQYQITEAKTNGYAVEKYGFDAYGRRVWTAQGTVTNFHTYDGVHCIADLNSTGGLVRTYTYGLGIDNLLAMTVYTSATMKTYFPLTDHLGTVHALADDTGAIVESYQFDAWGRVIEVRDSAGLLSMVNGLWSSPLGNRTLWQGREYSWATGLYYFRARWYDPITGRWLSNDPIGISGGLNQYCFCGNCPTMYRDPLGLEFEKPGFFGSLVPVVGSWRSLAHDVYEGNVGWGIVHGGEFVLDCTIVGGWAKTGIKALLKGGVKVSAEAVTAEIGAKTLSNAAWTKGLDALTDAERGAKYIREQGLLKALLPTWRGLFLGVGTEAFKKGPTLGVVLFGLPAIHGLVDFFEYETDLWFGDDCPKK